MEVKAKVHLRTVKELANWYMQIPSVQDQKSFDRKISGVNHILKYFGREPLNAIEGIQQEYYRAYRKNQGALSETIDLELAYLSAMYHRAIQEKMIPADFMPGKFVKQNKKNPRRIISDEQYKSILEKARPDFQDVLICAYESAMRSKEICNLTASQIHLDVSHISGETLDYIDLGIFDTKTGARRNIPVSETLKAVLKRRAEGLGMDDFVFTTKAGRKFSPMTIMFRMKTACEKAGGIYGDKPVNAKGERIGVVFHCFRHTRTSKWVSMGFSDEIVRRATGHQSLEAYQQYIKLDPATVMRLVKKPKQDTNGGKTLQSL